MENDTRTGEQWEYDYATLMFRLLYRPPHTTTTALVCYGRTKDECRHKIEMFYKRAAENREAKAWAER